MKQEAKTVTIRLKYSLWTLPSTLSMSLFFRNNKVPYRQPIKDHGIIDAYIRYQHHQQYRDQKIAKKMKKNLSGDQMKQQQQQQEHRQITKNVKESNKVLFSVHFDRSLLTRRLLNVVVVIVIILSSFLPNVIFVIVVLAFFTMIMSGLLSLLTTTKHHKQQQQQNDYFQHIQYLNHCDGDTSIMSKWNLDVVDNDGDCRHLAIFSYLVEPKKCHCIWILFHQIINNYVQCFVRFSSKINTLLVNHQQFKCMIVIFLIINNLTSLAFAQFINGAHRRFYNHHLHRDDNNNGHFRSLISSSSSSSFNPLNSDYMYDLFPQNNDQSDNIDEDDDDQTAYPTIRALVGKSVGLPCNISQSIREGNSIKLVLWYKNNILGSPIYSVDARDTQNLSIARHFLASSYQQRASFEMNLATRTASLIINPVEGDDDGHYICRVDYRWTRTTISNVRLEVIVPPYMIQIVQSYQYQPESISMLSSKMGVGQHGMYFPKKTNVTIDLNRKSFERNFYYNVRSTSPFTSSTYNDNNNKNANESPTQSSSSMRQSDSDANSGIPTSPTTMINDVTIIRQPESSTLTLNCDSIGGKPMSMIKWYRLAQFENANLTDAQLYTLLQSSEKSMQLIDDSYYPMLLAALPSNVPRLLFTNNLNLTSKNSVGTMQMTLNSAAAAAVGMSTMNKMNKNPIRSNHSITTTTTKMKDSSTMIMEPLFLKTIVVL
nr:uncharacterized protein LOC124494395 isoform X2 [Dermatophagoides farinae]